MIYIAIGHAAWAGDKRRENFNRLVRGVGPDYVHVSREQEHASVWARDIWEWAEKRCAPVCILNDDVEVCPDFREVLSAMQRHLPFGDGMRVGLHTTFPRSELEGRRPWVSSYWYTGPGVVISPSWARYLLQFWDAHQELHDANEDMVGIYAAYESRMPYWHPIPAPVQHRTDIRSTLGYDGHAHRLTTVPWTLPEFDGLDLTRDETWIAKPSRLEVPWMRDEQLRRLRKGETDEAEAGK